MTDTEFAELLTAAVDGDATAFAAIWRDTQPALLRYLRLVGGDAAEDVASETWLQVVKALGRFRGGRPEFRAWVFTIARRKATDAARARGRRPELPTGEWADSAAGAVPDPVTEVLERRSTGAALELIATLPADQAEVVLLRVVAGFTATEVAELLGTTPGAVRVSAHRGLRRLAARLGSDRAVTP